MEEVQVPHQVVGPRQGHQEVHRHRQKVVGALEGIRVVDPVEAHLDPAAVQEERIPPTNPAATNFMELDSMDDTMGLASGGGFIEYIEASRDCVSHQRLDRGGN